jgi:hypothetical protein
MQRDELRLSQRYDCGLAMSEGASDLYFPEMTTQPTRSKFILASVLFFASIASSFLFAYSSQQKVEYWVAAKTLPAGVQIQSGDLKPVKALLTDNSELYIDAHNNLNGQFLLRTINSGEFIYQAALQSKPSAVIRVEVAVGLSASDIPIGASAGKYISLYQVHDNRNGEAVVPPQFILSNLFITAINRENSNFGGGISLTLSVPVDDVPRLLEATSSGRLVAVGTHG